MVSVLSYSIPRCCITCPLTFYSPILCVRSARLDPASGTLAATASGDFTARLWCATSGKELAELKHKHVVRAVDFSMVRE